MSNWRAMLKEAKELFDDGLISDAEYDQLRKEALVFLNQSMNPGSMTPSATPSSNDNLTGSTSISRTAMNSTGGDPFGGDQQRIVKDFVSLCKSCLKLIQRIHVTVQELQTIVPDLFSVRSYPGETVPLSPSEIVQRFQEDKPPHIDTEAYNLNREDTEIHALVFTVVQIYSACWLIAQRYPDYAGQYVDEFEKRWHVFSSTVEQRYKCKIRFNLSWIGKLREELPKDDSLNFHFRKITSGYIGVDLSGVYQKGQIVGVRKAQIDFEGVDAQYLSEIILF